jgi:tRNA pseudouridine synthase 10
MEITDQILEIARAMPKLCDRCLGRQFAKIGHGIGNDERGKMIRKRTGIEEIEPKKCWLCGGLLSEIGKFADLVIEVVAEYEFDTYLIGSRIEPEILEREEKLRQEWSESIKREINREVGKSVGKKIGKEVDFCRPDITAIIDTQFDVVELDIRPLYIYGRYKKFIRGIPQTKWYCRVCRGLGCPNCNYSGKMYEESVEELIARPILDLTKGKGESFHAAGREDIDALMLGNGRPFIIEIKDPHRRNIDLSKLVIDNEKVKVEKMRFSSKEEIEKLKSSRWKKTYRIKIESDREIDEEKLNKIVDALQGRMIQQRTPLRVAHRRPDIIRNREIFDMKIEEINGNEATIIATVECGTYVKELINGNNGRTNPSFRGMGIDCGVKELDVIEVRGGL